jgi:hypothetical protein
VKLNAATTMSSSLRPRRAKTSVLIAAFVPSIHSKPFGDASPTWSAETSR